MIKDVTDLDVYKLSLDLLSKLYIYIREIPKSEQDTINQIKRAAKSISANIAEGFGKKSSAKEFKRFLKIAIGSSDEVITHLRTVYVTTKYLRPKTQTLAEEYKILSKRLNKLHSIWHSDNTDIPAI